jgi:cytochrome c oxidase subunit 4
MNTKEHHISPYSLYVKVLITLLLLTALSVLVTEISFGSFSVAVALLIASVKVTAVLLYFMHLKSESLFLKLLVAGVFLLFALVIIITFIDYLLR